MLVMKSDTANMTPSAVTKFKGDVQAYKSLIVQNVSWSLLESLANSTTRSKTSRLKVHYRIYRNKYTTRLLLSLQHTEFPRELSLAL